MPKPENLIDLALEPQREELRLAGAWPVAGLLTGGWRLPDGRILSEEEAFVWLRNAQDRQGDLLRQQNEGTGG